MVIDVGGFFLGFGEKPVALPLSAPKFLLSERGDALRVHLPLTEDERIQCRDILADAMPEPGTRHPARARRREDHCAGLSGMNEAEHDADATWQCYMPAGQEPT
ncbi:hypothetical protein [Marinibacterium profundimaris]|uniref:Uncharacterized protein n=1 Tax=Marinibacterium profundimaris TaxID=1679460 RepID=A0A225NBN7_9RHOB|nr:hypothetical protein [Marinibacterium profundimaris]OWU68115.1 hypothetical protein ATO3_24805 [Marinibacterium profundimaris]